MRRAPLTLAILMLCATVTGADSTDTATDSARFPNGESQLFRANNLLAEYIELIQTNNFESARQYWSLDAQERTKRLGITYEGVTIKSDNSSPMIKSARFEPAITLRSGRALDSIYSMLDITAEVRGQEVRHHYYVGELNGYPWLVFPQDYYCANWPIRESRYFRFHINPKELPFVSDVAMAELDAFVDSVGALLGITSERIKNLAELKVDYYYCEDENEVKRVTGNQGGAQGRYDLASDALFSETLTHFHEVTHLLVNYRLQSMPLNTLPFLKEGLATLLGGRAGLAAPGLLDMAAALYQIGEVNLDSLFEMMSFHTNADASFTYPGAALFLKCLADTYGMEALLELYRDLSGEFIHLTELTAADVRAAIERRTGAQWSEIMGVFNDRFVSGEFRKREDYPRLAPGGLAEVDGSALRQLKFATLAQREGRIYVVGEPNGDGAVRGSILFGRMGSAAPQRSNLFEEHFGELTPYDGYRYGIRFDGFEAGLYDYATSTLLAKHIAIFDTGAPYLDPVDSTVSFSFPLDLCNGVSPLEDAELFTH
ncbi:MAG TPA: hypothetical protein VLB27_07645 [candidate division Zixibacteria bacterium]|nr:hypothetical protein [candidate division Zixibacteria bacterium]